jgi:hypothetical protein
MATNESGAVRLTIAVVCGLVAALAAIPVAYMMTFYTRFSYVFVMLAVFVVASAVASFTSNIIYQATTCGGVDAKKAAIGAAITPAWTAGLVFVGAVLPVLLGAVPPRFRAGPRDGLAGYFNFLRVIPESVMSNTSMDNQFPAAEMFWAFWGALYGQMSAFSVVTC